MKITNATSDKNILKINHHVAIPVTIKTDAAGLEVIDGRNIMKAGMPIGGVGGSRLSDPTKYVEKKNINGAEAGTTGAALDAEGILLHDVDVTEKDNVGAMLIHGFPCIDKLPEAVAAEAQAAMKNIALLK